MKWNPLISKIRGIAALFIAIFLVPACNKPIAADLILYNARIYTVDSAFTIAEALAVKEGCILATGSSVEILKAYTAREKQDCQGATIVPGLIDAHCHFTGYATDKWKCSLVGTTSFDEVLSRIKSYAENAPRTWIYGRGWDQNDWETKEYPDNTQLNTLFPDRPVFLKRIDGHAALVNQVALDIAGITDHTKVEGGEVILKNGKPTGLLLDNAMDLVDQKVPPVPDSLAAVYLQEAEKECFALGLTQVQDMGMSEEMVNLLLNEHKNGRLKMKIFAALNDDETYYEKWIRNGPLKTDRLTVGGFKLYADGALGSRGACLLSPYQDKPNWHGFLLRDTAYLRNVVQRITESQLQLFTHAIGDSANRYMLQLYGKAIKGKERRWRIEHAQVISENDFSMFGNYDIIPSVQPTHATSDMYWATSRLGEKRIPYAYAYSSLQKQNGCLPLGTDFPVEEISPFKTFYAAVARKDSKGFPEDGFLPAEKLTREQALRGMTIWASYSVFEEKNKGSIEKGKCADLTILDRDIINCAEKELLNTKVIATFVNGEKVYSHKH